MSSGTAQSEPYEALRRCEDAFRIFAAEAAAAGDYERLTRLAATARRLVELAAEWGPDADGGDSAGGTEDPVEAQPSHLNERSGGGKRQRATIRREYPRFMRRESDLVKIGWSKAGHREYQHRAPHSLLVALGRALLDARKSRTLFTMDALERHLAANSVPEYQAYVWLAWLRSAKLVRQHGRQGYSVVNPATFEADIESAFAALPAQGL